MNVYASPASRQDGPREAATDAAAPPSQEIRYRKDAAGYVAAMLTELRQISGKAGFDRLVKSLDAAYYEAYAALDATAQETASAPRAGSAGPAAENNSNAMEPNAPQLR